MQPARTTAPRIEASRSFELDPGCELARVTAVVVQERGGVVVADARSSQLCFFDSRGRLIAKRGRAGGGPGEYRHIRFLDLLPADSLLVFDGQLMRLTVLSPSGVFVRATPIGDAPDGVTPMPSLVATLRNGEYLVGYPIMAAPMPPGPEPRMIMQSVWRVARDGRRVGRVGQFPIGEHFVQEMSPARGGIAFWDLPFGRRLSVVAVAGGFLAGDGSAEGIAAYDANGSRVGELRPPGEGRLVAAADKAAYRRAALAEVESRDRAVEERRLAETPYPARLPLFRTFAADGRGRLWLEPYPVPGAARSVPWQVWDTRTFTYHEVAMPAGFALRAAGGDVVCGTVESEDGEVVVRCVRVVG